jgi:hypothetical protein
MAERDERTGTHHGHAASKKYVRRLRMRATYRRTRWVRERAQEGAVGDRRTIVDNNGRLQAPWDNSTGVFNEKSDKAR